MRTIGKSKAATLIVCGFCAAASLYAQAPQAPAPAVVTPKAGLVLPLERTAYFVGEQVPLAVTGIAPGAAVKLEAVNADGRTLLYSGPAEPLMLDTARFAPGDYTLEANGARLLDRLTLTSPVRKSVGAMNDECAPDTQRQTPDQVHQVFAESGLTGVVQMGVADGGRCGYLDTLARSGAMAMVNPDTRPTSFFPASNEPGELDAMSQRAILIAQANGRYPNFAGFCFGWDTTGFAVGGRRGLLIYWGWGDKTQALRNYIERIDQAKLAEFTKRTGLKPVTEEEYIAYLVSIGRPEFAPMIDLPTKVWLEEIAQHAKPMPVAERAAFEKRLDAWSAYLMSLYGEVYGRLRDNLRSVAPALRNSSSVQSDHCPTRNGQYFPSAYAPLDLRYQSTWNDQVGGPDYVYQWLFVAGLLDMERAAGQPTWISNCFGAVHARAAIPGKFVRVAAHNLVYGGSGIGFAHEGFSNLLGGMNGDSAWAAIKGKAGAADVLAGREFLDRFAGLAVAGQGGHGVGILWSKTQLGRQNATMGFGEPAYNAFVTLTRLGYTPKFLTEDEIAKSATAGVKAIVIIGQTFPLPAAAQAGLDAFRAAGGRLLVDGSTTVAVAGAGKLALNSPSVMPGKPHSWGAPNMVRGENDAILFERWYPELARAFNAALADTGHAWLRSERGPATQVTLEQIDGGSDATYLVAVNDSWIGTQADWHQVRETLVPVKGAPEAAALYDCTEEKLIGTPGPFVCDLSRTTARVFALLPRPIARTAVVAGVSQGAAPAWSVTVWFEDAEKKPLVAVLPFHLALVRPDGKVHQEFYRTTARDGGFTMQVPRPANAPVGTWTVAVRSQLTGEVTSVGVGVKAARGAAVAGLARPLAAAAVAGGTWPTSDWILRLQKSKATVIIPVFDSPQYEAQLAAATQAKTVLGKLGITAEIRSKPEAVTYSLAYELTPAQAAENLRVDKGEAIGRLKRLTVNGNDWYSALGGWRCAQPVLLLDLVQEPAAGAGKKTERNANPMAGSLDEAGILWPRVSAAFPGSGKALVQVVPWAFAPRTDTLVIQAVDAAGLAAGVQALTAGPKPEMGTAMAAVTRQLWAELGVGAPAAGQTAAWKKLKPMRAEVVRSPQPFAIHFPTGEPQTAEQVKHPVLTANKAVPVPAVFEPKQFVLHYRIGEDWVETATVDFLMPDLRFSQAVMVVADVKQAGRVKVVADGVFRYADRMPCWQAQWEDIIRLRARLVPQQRRPVEFDVLVNGRPAGKLTAAKTEMKDVPVRFNPGGPPPTVNEEVVTRCAGEVELPAGRAEILLIKENITDGRLLKVGIGVEPEPAK